MKMIIRLKEHQAREALWRSSSVYYVRDTQIKHILTKIQIIILLLIDCLIFVQYT